MSDYQSTATARVEAINSPVEALSKTVWANDDNSDVFAGCLVRTATTSEDGCQKVTVPSVLGYNVTHVIKTAYDASDTDLLEQPLEAFVLTPGVELLVPETALAAGVGTVNPHDYLVSSATGYWARRNAATDIVVGEVLSQATEGGTGHFRVSVILRAIQG